MRIRYERVSAAFPQVRLTPEAGFRETLLTLVRTASHLLFVVDDVVFVRQWSVGEVVDALARNPLAIGYSLRLGRNTVYCYPFDRPQSPPLFDEDSGGVLSFDWTTSEFDFGYPLELSSSIYRRADLELLLEGLHYGSPNELESQLYAARATIATKPRLLCSPLSIAFSTPVNAVQSLFPNRRGVRADYSPGRLVALFDSGVRIDVDVLRGHTPRGCHEEIDLPLHGGPLPPRVSVVIPCYAQAELLPSAVGSVVAQTFENWEIVVVNDGSPDDTSAVTRGLCDKWPDRSIRLVEQQNRGLAAARNAGIASARGDLILPLDADDQLEPTFLEKTVAVLDQDLGAAIAFTDVVLFGTQHGIWRMGPFDLVHLRGNNRACSTSLYRRSVWEQVGGYNSNMVLGYEDWDFWVGAAERGFRAIHVGECLFRYRVKQGSMIETARHHHHQLRARIVLNHPSAFSAEESVEARASLARQPLPEVCPPPPASTDSPPLVSVVIPCFNQAEYLSSSVTSVVDQSFTDWEVIIVDDGSTDESAEVAERLAAEQPDRRIRLFRQANAGLAATRNAGIGAARGRYIVPLDADDELDPQFLAKTVGILESQPHVAAVGTDAVTFGEYAERLHARPLASVDAIKRNNCLNYCSPYRREVWETVGGYNPNMTFGYEDWDFWVGAKEKGFIFAHVAEPLFRYRVKANSMVTEARKLDRHLRTRVVLNHPSLYSGAERVEAETFLRSNPLPERRPVGVPRHACDSYASSGFSTALGDDAAADWRAQGCPLPPPHEIKVAAIRAMARAHGARVFMETGTYKGQTLAAVRDLFDRVISIELDPEIHHAADQRFAGDSGVRCIQGDSGVELARVLERIDVPALFWLDAHYSGPGTARSDRDTPIVDELHAILRHPVNGHVVLIDDARLFGINPAYPTLRSVMDMVDAARRDYTVDVAIDAIRITPASSSLRVAAASIDARPKLP